MIRCHFTSTFTFLVLMTCAYSGAHLLNNNEAHPQYDWSVRPPGATPSKFQLAAQAAVPLISSASAAPQSTANAPTQYLPFLAFSPMVRTRWNRDFLFVESNGLPTHGMMQGIMAWQQQVPLPQNYTGTNAWQIPLHPVPAASPVSIRGHFLRGAIAVAANGIPIFNPQNNHGEISQEIGELDKCGGHCGRADDYHYHIAPPHLQSTLGISLPIAYALDGYAIYGLTEPDGSSPAGLDSFNGHSTPALGYHYHASLKYPYVNGGFHGQVTEAGGQVDPQPRTQPIRPAQPPLDGAAVTTCTASPGNGSFHLAYTVNGRSASIDYAEIGSAWRFQFHQPDGTTREEIYPTR